MISDWIMNMIENREIELKTAGKSINRKIPKGCPQGGVLSPFLWNLVIDSLLNEFKNQENVQSFADDVCCFLSIGKIRYGIENKARNTMNQIIAWCTKNGLKISHLKTKIIYWSRSNQKEHPKVLIVDKTEYKLSKSVKYLGVTIDNKLNWNEHIEKSIAKCKRIFFAVKRAIGKNGD